jgi:integrase
VACLTWNSLIAVDQAEELVNAPMAAKRRRQAPAWAAARDAAIVELFYGSGLRLSELLALNASDIDPYAETVRVLSACPYSAFRNGSALDQLFLQFNCTTNEQPHS